MADTKLIFPEVPEDLKSASDETLAELSTKIQNLLVKVKIEAKKPASERDFELLGELSLTDVIEQTQATLPNLKAVQEEIAKRTETQDTFAAVIEKMVVEDAGVTAEAVVEETEEPEPETPEGEGNGTEAATSDVVAEAETITEEAAVEVAEPVLASGDLRAAKPRPPRPIKQHQAPVDTEPVGTPLTLVASGMASMAHGSVLDHDALVKAIIASNTPTGGSNEKVPIAHADFLPAWPEDRKLGLNGEQGFEIQRRIDETVSPQALVASGGLCAPVTPYYQLANVSIAARPVRDSLAGFAATRGGLQFARPATISSVAGGVGIKTAAQDALGGTNALKGCLAVTCPAFSTVNLEMIYRCLQFGNLNARSFPELIAQWTDLAIAYHARVADSALLDYIDASSTETTQGKIYGTASTVIDAWLYAAAGMRSRHRMDPNARFRVLAPNWLRSAISADIVNNQFNRFDVKPDGVDALLRSYGVEPTWYLDTPTAAGQIFAAQTAGALLNFPTTAITYIFPEGSFLFLDGGTLDLGIVRDSTLNSTNDFNIWAETFEAAAFVGVESLEIELTICNDGTFPALQTAATCS